MLVSCVPLSGETVTYFPDHNEVFIVLSPSYELIILSFIFGNPDHQLEFSNVLILVVQGKLVVNGEYELGLLETVGGVHLESVHLLLDEWWIRAQCYRVALKLLKREAKLTVTIKMMMFQ
jgi:hypothetical protein